MTTLPEDYPERVYAGVLGKLIGVYLGRPVEGWTYERIQAELEEIDGYVNERLPEKPPIVVVDDDISGTFTFFRALEDHGFSPDLTAEQIGHAWLNYLIEGRTILWWGGLGNSTEHSAYLRLKAGIPAPESGSIARNGPIVAQQIGAQIFIDAWAMAAPGDPELAVRLAGRAARVSHDGEAVFAAQVLAAMESLAFIEPDIDALLDGAVPFIPVDSTIRRMIDDLRSWHAAEKDWRKCRTKLADLYGYDRYAGVCHVVPNHGLILLGLLYGGGDFRRSMRIVNTSGWDTDCNAGNLGCLLGIRSGLQAFESEVDWRGPVADRLYISSADGGRAISDAVLETRYIVRAAQALHGLAPDSHPSPRFHFEFPGAVQGFQPEEPSTRLQNTALEDGTRGLQVTFREVAHVATPTFAPPEVLAGDGYHLSACPTLYPGQVIRAVLQSGERMGLRLFVDTTESDGSNRRVYSPSQPIDPGAPQVVTWRVPGTGGTPVARVGLAFSGPGGAASIRSLTWEGPPEVVFIRPVGEDGGVHAPWRRAWVDAVDHWDGRAEEAFRLSQNEGRGLLYQGTREWADYEAETEIRSWLAEAAGVVVCVQGLRRFYALQLLPEGRLQLVRVRDEDEVVLGERPFAWGFGEPVRLKLSVTGERLRAWAGEKLLFDRVDEEQPLQTGAAGFLIQGGTLSAHAFAVRPASNS